MSTDGSLVSTIGGLFLGSGVLALLCGGNADSIPVLLVVVFWIIGAAILSVFLK